MSRHRHVRNYKYDDDFYDDDMAASYSYDDSAISPSMSHFLVDRTNSDNTQGWRCAARDCRRPAANAVVGDRICRRPRAALHPRGC